MTGKPAVRVGLRLVRQGLRLQAKAVPDDVPVRNGLDTMADNRKIAQKKESVAPYIQLMDS